MARNILIAIVTVLVDAGSVGCGTLGQSDCSSGVMCVSSQAQADALNRNPGCMDYAYCPAADGGAPADSGADGE